jgi:cold shock CspA family protein
MSRSYGRVAWFSSKKGYGFIDPIRTHGEYEKLTTEKTGIFIHYSNIQMKHAKFANLLRREFVEFDVTWDETRKSFIALNITGPWGETLMLDEDKPVSTESK